MSRKKQAPRVDAPAESTRLVLSEHLASAGTPLDQNQAKLQRLIKQIEGQRQRLQEWRDFEIGFREKVMTQMPPVKEELRHYQRGIVFALDTALKTRGWLTGKGQKNQAQTLIIAMSRDLLDEQPDDDELEALHDEYSDLSLAEEQEIQEMLRERQELLMSALFGGTPEDYGDDDLVRERIKASFKPQDSHTAPPGCAEAAKARPRRPTKREIAAEKRAQEASQSVRQVFRKLASTLHPDRENDPAERERKTALMQRVNEAYARNDLLGLLSLQFEIEQIDTEHFARLDAERTRQYIHVFTGQLNELKREIDNLTAPYRNLLGQYRGILRPRTVEQGFAADLAACRSRAREYQHGLAQCQDKLTIKPWLKQFYYAALDEADDEDRLMF